MVKNCDLGLENTARGRRPRAAFSKPRVGGLYQRMLLRCLFLRLAVVVGS